MSSSGCGQQKNRIDNVEQERTLLLLLLGGLLLSSRGRGVGSSTGGSGRGGRSVLVRVGNTVLELGDGLPLVVGLDGNRDKVLVAVDNGVDNRGKSRVVGGQGDGGNGGNCRGEGLEKLALLNVEDAAGTGLTVVVDLGDTHTVREGRDVQHVEEGGLGGTDLVAGLNELEIGGDLNGTTGNLGRDTESLEERGLAGFHTSVSGRNVDIGRSNGTSTSRGSDAVGEDLLTGVLEITVGEDETDVT